MFIQGYQVAELHFAYCYHVYLRWSTYRLQPFQPLARLDQAGLTELVEPYGIHILECKSGPTDLRVLASLKPEESIATCASKLKGRVSRWLREALHREQAANLLSKGYFACTSGKSTREEVEKYLDQQSEHHGYADRVLPPVFVREYTPSGELESRVEAKHAFTRLQFHLVLTT